MMWLTLKSGFAQERYTDVIEMSIVQLVGFDWYGIFSGPASDSEDWVLIFSIFKYENYYALNK